MVAPAAPPREGLMRTRRTRGAWSLPVLTLALLACGGRTAAPDPTVTTDTLEVGGGVEPRDDAGAAPALEDAGPDCPDASEPTLPELPELPPCDRACDRVADCSVAACPGFDWTTVAGLDGTCHAACSGGSLADDLLAAVDCDGVEQLATGTLPDYATLCQENPCKIGCDKLGACLVEECPALGESVAETAAADCASDCVPADVFWVISAETCADVIDPIRASSPQFAAACLGEESPCAEVAECEAYAAKVAGCVSEHCSEAMAPYLGGMETIFLNYCAYDPACPAPDGVAWVNQDEVTCDSPALAEAGPAPPFTELCAGEAKVTAEVAQQACEALLACPGTEGIGGVEVCMVWLAIRVDAAERAACLIGAAGDCVALWACLEDW
jgi:hypothetical protein